jgi:dynein heavy chain 2
VNLQGVLLVMGQQDTSWNNMKKFLGSKVVKDEVRVTQSAL